MICAAEWRNDFGQRNPHSVRAHPLLPAIFLPSGTDSVPNLFGTVVDGLRLPGHRLRLGRAGLMQVEFKAMNPYCCAAVAPLWTFSRPMADGLSSLASSVLCTVCPPDAPGMQVLEYLSLRNGTPRSASPPGRFPRRTLFGTLVDGHCPPGYRLCSALVARV